MKSPRQRTISVEEVHYLEWHDGLVRGILDTPNGPSLVALVAWDPDTRRRAYILLGLNSDDSERLKQFAGLASGDAGKLHARWAAMQAEFERVLQRCKSSFAMTRTEPAKGSRFGVFELDPDDVQALADYDLEKALSKSAWDKWFASR